MQLTILRDIYNGKRKLVATAGEIVTLISIHDTILIVQGKDTFSVHKDLTNFSTIKQQQ